MTVIKAKVGTEFITLSGGSSNVWVGPSPPTNPNIEFWIDTDANLPVVPWINATLQNAWVNHGGGRSPTSYRKIGDIVYFRVAVNSGVSGTVIFTLPVGYCPPAIVDFIGRESGSYPGTFNINANGTVVWYSAGGSSAIVCINGEFSVTV